MLIYANVEPESSLGFDRKSIAARCIDVSRRTERHQPAINENSHSRTRLRSSRIGVYLRAGGCSDLGNKEQPVELRFNVYHVQKNVHWTSVRRSRDPLVEQQDRTSVYF